MSFHPRGATIAAHLAVVVLAMAQAPLAGQDNAQPVSDWRPHRLTLTALAGGAAYTSFLRVDATTDADEHITARTSLAVAGALAYWPSSAWGVRVHGGWAPTRFEREQRGGSEPGSRPDSAGAALTIWTADLDVLIRLPLGLGRLATYGLIGGGVVRYAAAGDGLLPVEARVDFAEGSTTRAALVVGAGGLIPLQRNHLVLTFELTDHLTRSPVAGPEGQEDRLTSNVRLLVGLTLPLAGPDRR